MKRLVINFKDVKSLMFYDENYRKDSTEELMSLYNYKISKVRLTAVQDIPAGFEELFLSTMQARESFFKREGIVGFVIA